MDEKRVTFHSGKLRLEGLLATAAGSSPTGAAVVCHPHPLYGGSMHNNVVEAVLDAMWTLGRATLRFNFRGVGASEGEHDEGRGEADDALAATGYLASEIGGAPQRITLAGYSFGAMVAMRAGLGAANVAEVVAVALAVATVDFSGAGTASKPVLLVSGDRDSYSPADKVRTLGAGLGKQARVHLVAGADHFFGGFEGELSAAIAGALRAPK
ncbi:MAG: alpha/beta hydrolase [Candidatus Binataceae bacterium]